MVDFIDYTKELMESAKGFAEQGRVATDPRAEQAYLRAALFQAISFLEGHINDVAEQFRHTSMFTIHQKGILLEREVTLRNGAFRLSNKTKYQRILDRIDMLILTGGGTQAKETSWHSPLCHALKLRNELVHPREIKRLKYKEVIESLKAVLDCVDAVFKAIFKKGLPYAGKSMDSSFLLDVD